MRTLNKTYMGLIYLDIRKRQDLLSKLGAWRPWERVVEGGDREGADKNVELYKRNFK